MPLPKTTNGDEPTEVEQTPYLGTAYVALYAGATRVATVPDKPVVTKVGVNLTWSAPSNGGSAITSYNVYVPALFPPVASGVTSPWDTTGTTGPWRVTAVNAVGEGLKSAPVS